MRSKKKKKDLDLTIISEKVNIRYTFDEKKSEHQFQNFWQILTRFEEISEILAKLSKFSLFLTIFEFKNELFFYFQAFFSSFLNFFQILSKMAKINKKSLLNPMNFLFFESRNLHSRAESV